MSLAIYRKYRPQKWSDLTGQNHIKVTLQNEIEAGKIAHAYLFTGPRGIGKTTSARLFAKAINCENRKEGESQACGTCNSCLELVEGNDLDILEIDAASHTGVDNVRENIIANARFTPAKRKYKVFIIDEVHMLSISAFNALLKILEEPPEYAIFILATTEIHKVPATIISRCQRFDFKKINAEDLIKRLSMICQQEEVKVPKKVLADIARISEGASRDAESLLGQILSLGEKEVSEEEASLIIPATHYDSVLELTDCLENKNSQQAISLINKLTDEGADLLQLTDELIEFLRRILLGKITGSLKDFSLDLDQDMEKKIVDLSGKFEVNELIELINIFISKKQEIKTAAIVQLPLEVAVIEYCSSYAVVNKKSVTADDGKSKQSSASASDEASVDRSEDKDQGSSGGVSNADPPQQESQSDQGEKIKSTIEDNENNKISPPTIKASEDKSQEDLNGGTSSATLKISNSEDSDQDQSQDKLSPDQEEKAEVCNTDVQQVDIKLDEIKEQWNSFLVKLQETNASLVFILKVAEPLELNQNALKIGFKYEFHQQRVMQSGIKESIEKTMKGFFNQPLVIDTCLLDKDYESDFLKQQSQHDEVELVDQLPEGEGDKDQQELIDKLVETFDGKVVE